MLPRVKKCKFLIPKGSRHWVKLFPPFGEGGWAPDVEAIACARSGFLQWHAFSFSACPIFHFSWLAWPVQVLSPLSEIQVADLAVRSHRQIELEDRPSTARERMSLEVTPCETPLASLRRPSHLAIQTAFVGCFRAFPVVFRLSPAVCAEFPVADSDLARDACR